MQFRISIHAPRVGSDESLRFLRQANQSFLSTLPAWGATVYISVVGYSYYISIHAPRVGSDVWQGWRRQWRRISIHAPRVGSDSLTGFYPNPEDQFLSTLPAWGATLTDDVSSGGKIISIHAPRVGSDIPHFAVENRLDNISIHAPRVGSDRIQDAMTGPVADISIHAPRVGSD